VPEPLPGISSLPSRITKEWVGAAAESQGVHPIVVVGRLQSTEAVPWRSALAQGAPNVTTELERW
jgi:HTH-type transcriptional regulator/antitoxin HigA